MFNKSYIKKAAAIAAVILAATALPVNMANADTQTTGSTVTGSTLTGITANQAASEYTEIRTASELVEMCIRDSNKLRVRVSFNCAGEGFRLPALGRVASNIEHNSIIMHFSI